MLHYFKDRTMGGIRHHLRQTQRATSVNDDEFLNAALVLDDYEGGHAHAHDEEGHGHGHKDEGHKHGTPEEEAEAKYNKAMGQLKKVLALGCVFVCAQGVGAYLAGSIAIATDCAHLASDLIGFMMGMVALSLTRRGESSDYTFGWHRAEILGTIVSIVFLLTLTIWLLVEATKRIFIDYIIDGEIMLITAVLSLIFNLIMMDVLHQGPGHDHDHDHGDGHGHSHGHSHSHEEKADLGKSKSAIESQKAVAAENSKNINVDAAYLHALSDMLLSIGVCIAALVIYIWPVQQYPWSKYADPFCTLVFSILVCMTCKPILSNCCYILMEGAPEAVDSVALKEELEKLQDGTVKVSEYHIWSLSKGKYVFLAQMQCDGDRKGVTEQATKIVNDFGITNLTL